MQPGEFVTDISEVRTALFRRVESHATQHRISEDHDLILGAVRLNVGRLNKLATSCVGTAF